MTHMDDTKGCQLSNLILKYCFNSINVIYNECQKLKWIFYKWFYSEIKQWPDFEIYLKTI